LTACISSQIGCSLTCSFCATGKLKRIRNLDAAEIVDQVVLIDDLALKYYQQGLTNIVYMGMGEPLLNYANTLRSAERITAEDGLAMGARRITVSTAGIAKMIRKLADDGAVQPRLEPACGERCQARPDHADQRAEHAQRTEGCPALLHPHHPQGVTFEYILFRGFNDSLADAQELVRYASDVHAKVNLIEYNPIDGGEFGRTDTKMRWRFMHYLENKGIVRASGAAEGATSMRLAGNWPTRTNRP
jgi:23S rRNA (adenine2503-C2)-methyltransferase